MVFVSSPHAEPVTLTQSQGRDSQGGSVSKGSQLLMMFTSVGWPSWGKSQCLLDQSRKNMMNLDIVGL